MTHLRADDDVVGTVALYALGALDAGEREIFERHLAEGCAVCEGQVSALTPVAADLGRAASPRAPRPEVRDRLLGRLTASRSLVRADEGAWERVALGVEMRRLHRDDDGRVTAVVRMAPGTRLPRHRHVSAEQFFMLSGDAQIDGETLGPGDYCRATAGTSHDVTYTERGCEFLLISSAIEVL